MNNIFHSTLNEIREKYAGKVASVLDVFDIEKKHGLCSLVNVRNDNCVFLRITYLGFDITVFEDIVMNLDIIKTNMNLSYNELLFEAKKILYNQAYGIILEKENKRLIRSSLHKRKNDIKDSYDEISKLKKYISDLEEEVRKLKNKPQQQSFLDYKDGV